MTTITSAQDRIIALCKDIPLITNAWASEVGLASMPTVPAFVVRRGRSISIRRQGTAALVTREYLLLLYVQEIGNDAGTEDETARANAAKWIPTVHKFFRDKPRLDRPTGLSGVTQAEIVSDTGDVILWTINATRRYAGAAFRMQVTAVEE